MSQPLHLLCLNRNAIPKFWSPAFQKAVSAFGSLQLEAHTEAWPADRVLAAIRRCDVLLTGHCTLPVPSAILDDPGRLRYICHTAGTIRKWVPRAFIEAGFCVSNWGPAPAFAVAEAAMSLLLACLKNLPQHVLDKRSGTWQPAEPYPAGSLHGLPVGVFGLGAIGQQFVDLLRPFLPVIHGFDPYLPAHAWPADVHRVDSLDALCKASFALILHAGLSDETRHCIAAPQLALLPDNAVLINTARGALIDHNALFAELQSGRLRAGLDVLDVDGKDWLPPGHPAAHWPNVIFTGHRLSASPWPSHAQCPNRPPDATQQVVLDNLQLFATGQSPRYTFDLQRFDRST